MKRRQGVSLINVMVFMMFTVMITTQMFYFVKWSAESVSEERELMTYRMGLNSIIEEALNVVKVASVNTGGGGWGNGGNGGDNGTDEPDEPKYNFDENITQSDLEKLTPTQQQQFATILNDAYKAYKDEPYIFGQSLSSTVYGYLDSAQKQLNSKYGSLATVMEYLNKFKDGIAGTKYEDDYKEIINKLNEALNAAEGGASTNS